MSESVLISWERAKCLNSDELFQHPCTQGRSGQYLQCICAYKFKEGYKLAIILLQVVSVLRQSSSKCSLGEKIHFEKKKNANKDCSLLDQLQYLVNYR